MKKITDFRMKNHNISVVVTFLRCDVDLALSVLPSIFVGLSRRKHPLICPRKEEAVPESKPTLTKLSFHPSSRLFSSSTFVSASVLIFCCKLRSLTSFILWLLFCNLLSSFFLPLSCHEMNTWLFLSISPTSCFCFCLLLSSFLFLLRSSSIQFYHFSFLHFLESSNLSLKLTYSA